ncbi:MAG TPA: protein kinase [Gemmataceae bacterium]|nr:protein kinase [Gemmataceae bacterium]
MRPCLSAETLRRLLDGLLSEEDGRRSGEHLRACPSCRARLDQLCEDGELRTWAGGAGRPAAWEEAGLARAVAALKAGPGLGGADTPTGGATPPPGPRPEEVCAWPSAVGPYTLAEELGRGGMGVVFKAHDGALRRTVAVKLLRPGLADAEARARFLREARAAARFHHEHAVAVYAADHTADGLPYLVMEYVAGPTLAGLIRARQRLEPHEAVAVVVQVADALAAAHAAGLIHRDVKPGNVLLEAAESPAGVLRAKLADFGLARDAAPGTALTREGVLAGTPAYMSPEQVRGGEALDGRTDVFSLGVTLYEALTGEPPFRGAPHLVLQQVLHEAPQPPRRLNDAIPRDLETVCLKALEKDPGRRYPGAAELAADLRRWQRGEPTRARPPGPVGRLARWARRKPKVTALAAALTLTLIGGTAVSLWQWSQAVAERDAAQLQRDAAERERRHALDEFRRQRQTVDQFLTDVSEDPELKSRNLEPLRRKLLQRARDEYERFVADYPDDPELLADLGRARARLGDIVAILDSQPRATEHFEKARTIFERLRREHPDEAAYQSELARALQRLGTAHNAAGQGALAEEEFRTARALWEELARVDPDDAEYTYRLIQTLNNLGRVHQMRKANDAAEEAYGAGRVAYARWAERHPAEPRHQDALAWLLANLGSFYRDTGRPADAAEVLTEAVTVAAGLVREHPGVDWYKETLFHAANEQGIRHAQRGEGEKAVAAWQQAEAAAEELVRKHPSADDYQESAAAVAMNLGLLAQYQGRAADALASYRKALSIHERLCGQYPKVVPYLVARNANRVGLARLLTDTNQLPAALELWDGAIRAWESAGAPDKLDPSQRWFASVEYHERAVLLQRLKRYAEALADYDRALALGTDEQKPLWRLERAAVEGYDCVAKGEYRRAATLAEHVAGQAPRDGYLLYLAATVLSLDAAAVKADERTPLAERQRLAEEYAARSVRLLRLAQQAGRYRDPSGYTSLATDEYLTFLRPRDDFQRLLADVKAGPAPAKP